MVATPRFRPIIWWGNTKKIISGLDDDLKMQFGHGLHEAQAGLMPTIAKPLKGYGGAHVLELVADSNRSTFRCVYTVQFPEAIYVLHVFQKKSTQGIATPQREMDVINTRLREAKADYEARFVLKGRRRRGQDE